MIFLTLIATPIVNIQYLTKVYRFQIHIHNPLTNFDTERAYHHSSTLKGFSSVTFQNQTHK